MNYRFLRGFTLAVLSIAMLAACQPAPAPVISVELALGEPDEGTTAGSMFMVIKNTGNAADKLLSGTSPACAWIEIHKTVIKDDGSLGMNLIDKPLEIPANSQLELMRGGTHMMCIQMNEQFTPGAKVNLTLTFEKSGEKIVSVLIRK
jgi:periplasmic copper chaperone A